MGTLNTPLRSTEHSSGAGVIYDDDSDDSKYAFDEHLSTPVMKLSQMSDMDRRSHSTSKTGQPFFERAFSTIEVGSVRGSIFTLTSTAIGAGLLSLPMVLKMVGVGLGLVMVSRCVYCSLI